MVRLASRSMREYIRSTLRCVSRLCTCPVCAKRGGLTSHTGYDTGVISGALVTIGGDLGPAELSSGQKVRLPELVEA